MEQCFEITKESRAYKEYFNWDANQKEVHTVVNNFFKENSIESKYYYARSELLYIEDNEKNRRQFGGQLVKNGVDGIVSFKKASVLGKAWQALNLNAVSRPYLPIYFAGVAGKTRTRLFHIDDKVYCSIELCSSDMKLETPAGFIEMKASEFFKIIEDASVCDN